MGLGSAECQGGYSKRAYPDTDSLSGADPLAEHARREHDGDGRVEGSEDSGDTEARQSGGDRECERARGTEHT